MDDSKIDENIVQLDVFRIERNKPRKCVCEVPVYTVDTKNREITCDCGQVIDAFEAMLDLANRYDRINQQHEAMHRQKQEWARQKPWSVLFKDLERHYKRGTMLPSCPECEQTFDFNDITFWTNAEYYRKLKQSKK